MTKEKIIETIEELKIGETMSGNIVIASDGINKFADELLAEFEQEKKELLALFEQEGKEIALSVVQDVKHNLGLNPDLHIIDGFNQRIEQKKKETAREIFAKIYNEIEYYSLGQIAIRQLAKEYGVDL